MNIQDSGGVKNRIRIRSIFAATLVYLGATAVFYQVSAVLVLIPITFSLVTIIISTLICNKEIESAKSDSLRFKKSLPFKYFGIAFGDFQHVFYYKESLETEILSTIVHNLKKRTPISELETIELSDIDKELANPEKRYFMKTDCGTTKRGTSITLIIKLSNFGGMQSVRWWVLVGGYIDKDKKFNFIAYSPLTLLFWIIPYLKKEHDVLSNIRTIYSASFNDMDITTQIRCLHEAVFDAMVEDLEKNGIDTSDIKVQRMQVMNISISGGKVNMGNVVQGGMNKISAKVVTGVKQ
jgi:hypothetical protein